MIKFVKLGLLLFGLGTIAAIAFPFVEHVMEQRHQQQVETQEEVERQREILGDSFGKVQLQNDQVLLTPRSGFLRIPDAEPFDNPTLFSVGSQFKMIAHHWGGTYTITRIESDGVVVDFAVGGFSMEVPPPHQWHSSGTVKMAWK